MKTLTSVLLSAAFLLLAPDASAQARSQAQSYPSGVVKLIVPYPPGGVVDLTGRLLAAQLEKQLGGTVIVENRPGAGGTIGAHHVARAAPDGQTLLIAGAATHAFGPHVFKSLPYDPIKDFVPITQVTEGPLLLVVNAASDLKTLADFVRRFKGLGQATNYASNGNGTYPHLAVELLKQNAGFDSTHIPYKGGGQAVMALLGREVDFSLNHIPIVLPQVKAGKLRALATSGAGRSSSYPDLPTLKEGGFDVVASAWFGLFAPANTPAPIIDRLYRATRDALRTPELSKAILAQGDEIVVDGPQKFLAFQKAELQKWGGVIRAAGVKPD